MLMRDKVGDLDSPKHGKTDPTGAPHVGGNTWAGGTGGRDTAGKIFCLARYKYDVFLVKSNKLSTELRLKL